METSEELVTVGKFNSGDQGGWEVVKEMVMTVHHEALPTWVMEGCAAQRYMNVSTNYVIYNGVKRKIYKHQRRWELLLASDEEAPGEKEKKIQKLLEEQRQINEKLAELGYHP